MKMEAGAAEEILKLLDSSLSVIKWRLRPSSKRRLETDVLALCAGLRAVVMVDYGGKMPELQNHLCSLLSLISKESTILLPLRVMIIDDMIYMVHPKELAEYAVASLSSETQLLFIDLAKDPPKMLLHTDQNLVLSELLSIQKLFLSIFSVDDTCAQPSGCKAIDNVCASTPQISELIDLSGIMKDVQITLPTLNGWLLGYPVVYLFGKDHATDAVYNLSTKSLHIYQIMIKRSRKSDTKFEELMSFTVPYDLSLREEKEPWAEAFLARLLAKFECCKPVWTNMQLEVNQCYPQSIVL
ncbi:uncharacterized protein LOC109837613 isoform X2 [Asparagus officinalis]|uniref:uncharacterized protein LOC109837613 isoform X2 n=2 Tax=Asparagus officinalis TaxID=4686 RepID=UPI00098DE4CD|nr:uncharacterized protein LOC109837613 isoform X2 [Asparagus officinalis]